MTLAHTNGAVAGPAADLADLAGLRVLVTCGGHLADRLAAGLREVGAVPLHAPLTRVVLPLDSAALDRALSSWSHGEFDWLLVTSPNGAAAVGQWMAQQGGAANAHAVGAVGPGTERALAEHGVRVSLVPPRNVSAAGLAEAFLAQHPGPHSRRPGPPGPPLRVLLPVSEIAGTELETQLTQVGHRVERVTAYRTVTAPPDAALASRVVAGTADAILVASGSAAREVAYRFRSTFRATASRKPLVVAIGEPTADALAQHHIVADAIAAEPSAYGLLDALARAVRRSQAVSSATAEHNSSAARGSKTGSQK